MKFNFKKISAIATSVLLAGMTMGVAAAAYYPQPFVDGTADVAIVYGASSLDEGFATNIETDLAASFTGGAVTVIEGESASLASGSDLMYLNDEFNENVETLTKGDLPTILADGTFTDDEGTDYNFEQTISIGSHADNHFAFSSSDNDLDDPTLIVELSDSAANEIYTWTVTFNTAVNFTDSDSEGEEISIFGKTYTIGTATDDNTLVLLGGSDSTRIDVGDTVPMTINGESYAVTLDAISDATTAQASITVNGETKTFTEGQTKTIKDVDVYVKTVFRTGEGTGHVEIQLGADKLTLETGNAVQIGSDNDDIDGTLVTFTPSTSTGVQALTKIQIEVAAENNDANHLLVGESFIDPVFGSLAVVFEDIVNGPTIVNHHDTARTELSIEKGGDRELQLELTDKSGNTATIPFAYQGTLQNDNGDDIEIIEGASIADEEYFILNSGENQHFMQLTTYNCDDGANSDIAMKDQITGETYTFSNHDFTSGYDAVILGKTYTITNDTSTTVTIVSSDFDTNIAVYPYIELVSGEDTRFAFTDEVNVFTDATSSSNKTVELPTGDVVVTFADSATLDCVITLAVTGGTTYTHTNATGDYLAGVEDGITVGSVDYVVNISGETDENDVCTGVDISFALEAAQTADAVVQETDPAILFVEDEDKSESTTTTKNAVILATTDGGSSSYMTCSAPIFTSTGYDTDTFDDSDYTGYLTNFGTYILRDSSDDNQAFTSLTYPEDIMYAKISFAEASAISTTGTGLGNVVIMDSETSAMSNKNLIVVGGSCINAVAAKLLGSDTPLCGAAFTEKTGVGAGGYIIKSYDNPYNTGSKIALLVAGYNVDDTQAAKEYLLSQNVNTALGSEEVKVIGVL